MGEKPSTYERMCRIVKLQVANALRSLREKPRVYAGRSALLQDGEK